MTWTASMTTMAPPRQYKKRRQSRTKSKRLFTVTKTIVAMNAVLLMMIAVDVGAYRNDEYYQTRRAASKPWLMKEFKLVDLSDSAYNQLVALVDSQGLDTNMVPKEIYLSPFTIILATLVIANVWSWLSYHLSGTWVEASHILIKDTSPKTLKALVGLKAQLGKDATLFGKTAKEYSQCPSSHQNGDLGRFGPGVMAPPFDKICFDPSTPINETIGPVQTQFGYHLIYLRKRKF